MRSKEEVMDLDGLNIVVTGAAGGLGVPAVLELLRRGASVCAADVNAEGLQALRKTAGPLAPKLYLAALDITDPAQVTQCVQDQMIYWDHVDGLINNAGRLRGVGPLWEVDPEEWWNDVTVNLFGTFLACRAVLPYMRKENRGVIINITGGGLSGPNPAGSGYGCSKAALARLTDTLAEELKDKPGIQVFGLSPGFVRSGITEFLATEKAAQPWFDYCREWLDAGKDNSAEGVATFLADMVLHREELPQGRVFYWNDDVNELAENANDILARDIRQLRYLRE
jgi:NAD(P)-dependent dehydrogenase (short-subunit alcohol dehydrogenase family)